MFREVADEETDDSLLSLDDEVLDVKYCDDVDNTDVVVGIVVEENVVTVLDVDVADDVMDKNEDVVC